MDAKPAVIPREKHSLSRSQFDKRALNILYRLHEAGHEAYLVGGCVRDLLLDKHPKDFDVATSATPEEVKALFKNCRIIGRRFRLAHIYFGRHIIEVATFRANMEDSEHLQKRDGMLVRDNLYGSIEEDAWRRDFSINALYYNIADFSLVDYVGGLKHIKRREIHILGDAKTRYREDPVRMLRAIRFAAKLNFKIGKDTANPIQECADWLEYVPPSRMLDELIKLFHSGHATDVYSLLKKHAVFEIILPASHNAMLDEPKKIDKLFTQLFKDTDSRIGENKTTSPIYLFAALLWPAVIKLKNEIHANGELSHAQSLIEAGFQIMGDQNSISSLPKRFQASIHQIWRLQFRLEKPSSRQLNRTLDNPRFRAGFDLLKLRASTDKTLKPMVAYWEKAQTER